jgi:hypothetical protein
LLAAKELLCDRKSLPCYPRPLPVQFPAAKFLRPQHRICAMNVEGIGVPVFRDVPAPV